MRGRVGYAFDRFLPYFTGGLAFGDVEARRTGFAGSKDTNAGWTVGVGIEGVIAGNWTAKVEYLYADLGDTTCSALACGTATNVDLQLNILRARSELPLLTRTTHCKLEAPDLPVRGFIFLPRAQRLRKSVQPNSPAAR